MHDDLPWYAVQVRSKYEKRVSAALAGKGYDSFLPLYPSGRLWSDRSKTLALPLFPGYTFCRLDLRARLLPVLTTPGVVSIVGAGNVPVPIPDSEIDTLKAVVNSGVPVLPWPSLTVGTRVCIERGPLAGVEGVVLSTDKGFRLLASISLLQRAVSVEIDRDCVRPIVTRIYERGNMARCRKQIQDTAA